MDISHCLLNIEEEVKLFLKIMVSKMVGVQVGTCLLWRSVRLKLLESDPVGNSRNAFRKVDVVCVKTG